MRSEKIRSESWSSFHQKHHSQSFRNSAQNEAALWRAHNGSKILICTEEEEQGWFSSMLDSFLSSCDPRPSSNNYNNSNSSSLRLMMAANDDDASFTSVSSGSSSGRRTKAVRETKKGGFLRPGKRKGNVKISDFSR